MTKYRILSLNLLCGTFTSPFPYNRLLQQINKIQLLDPDIICLQEFNNPFIEYIYKIKLSNIYNFYIERISLSEIFRRIIIIWTIGFLFYFINKILFIIYWLIIYYPYILLFIIGNQETGNAILYKKNLKIDNFSTKRYNYQSGDFLNIIRKRGYIKFNINNITIINTHLNHTNETQKNQIKELLDLTDEKVIIIGDLNTENITEFINKKFIDAGKYLGHTLRINNPNVTDIIKKDKRIDFVLYRNITDILIDKHYLESDHDGLLFEM